MGKIKVLHISQAAGGVQRHLISVLEKINKTKFEIVGICPPEDLVKGVSRDKETFVQAFERLGIRVHPIKMHRAIRPISDLIAFIKIKRFIKKERFDIVHTYSSKAGFLGRIAARLAGVPVCIHMPQSFAFDRPFSMRVQRLFYTALEKFAARFCDAFAAVCEEEKDLVVKYLGVPETKCEIISNAVDLSDYKTVDVDVSKKKDELGIGAKGKVLVFVGRFADQKAPIDLVMAMERVKRMTQKDFVCLMLGDGPLTGKVTDYVREKGCSDFIEVLGWRNDIKEIIAASDIFVLPSLWEVMPNHSTLDAMALKKPIVITDTLGARDLVKDGYNGFVVPKGKHLLLAGAVAELLSLNDSALKEYGLRSREILEKRPSLKDVVRRLENLYERLLCNKARLKQQ